MKLHDIKPRPGAKHRVKRLGKGESSGLGKTSGKGHKGQKARSGGTIRPGFEGGQMPLHRRLPKRGFNNYTFATKFAIVNVKQLEEKFEAGEVVSEESLREKSMIKGRFDAVKVLGEGELTKKLTVIADKVSASAQSKIEAAGGSVEAPAKKAAASEEATA